MKDKGSTGQAGAGEQSRLERRVVELEEMVRQQESEGRDLQEQHDFAMTLIYSTPHPVIVVNPDCRVRYVNPAFEAFTGFTSDAVVGVGTPRPWWDPEAARWGNSRGIAMRQATLSWPNARHDAHDGRIRSARSFYRLPPRRRSPMRYRRANSLEISGTNRVRGCSPGVVRVEGLEPPRLAAPEPKSGASANFATPAIPESGPCSGTAPEIRALLTRLSGLCEWKKRPGKCPARTHS